MKRWMSGLALLVALAAPASAETNQEHLDKLNKKSTDLEKALTDIIKKRQDGKDAIVKVSHDIDPGDERGQHLKDKDGKDDKWKFNQGLKDRGDDIWWNWDQMRKRVESEKNWVNDVKGKFEVYMNKKKDDNSFGNAVKQGVSFGLWGNSNSEHGGGGAGETFEKDRFNDYLSKVVHNDLGDLYNLSKLDYKIKDIK